MYSFDLYLRDTKNIMYDDHLVEWSEGKATTPIIENGKIYGRGDDDC
jgi:hypothetical protein